MCLIPLIDNKQQPLTGLGLGGWWTKVQTTIVEGGPHNAYLQLYSDAGIMGIIALIIAIAIFFRLLWRTSHYSPDSPFFAATTGIIAGVISGGVHALFDVNTIVLIAAPNTHIFFTVPLLWIWVAFLAVAYRGLVSSAEKIEKQRQSKERIDLDGGRI
jgi:hypothetical protein